MTVFTWGGFFTGVSLPLMKDPEVKKIPSALKWMAEKRARIAHDAQQTERILIELTVRRDSLTADLAAMDRALTIYDPTINPEKIGFVNGWKGKAGKRGSLRGAILQTLKSHEPEWVSSSNIASLVMLELGLSFELPRLRKQWYIGSFRGTLHKLLKDGLIDREAPPAEATGDACRWRLKQEVAPTLAELRDAA